MHSRNTFEKENTTERERERCIKKCDDEKPAATPALTEKKEKQNAVGKTH